MEWRAAWGDPRPYTPELKDPKDLRVPSWASHEVAKVLRTCV